MEPAHISSLTEEYLSQITTDNRHWEEGPEDHRKAKRDNLIVKEQYERGRRRKC